MLVIMILLIFLAQEVKKSYIAAIPLFASLILILVHGIHLFTLPKEYQDLIPVLSRCLVVDFLFVGISFFGYLWVDDIEAKEKGIKRVDDSSNWSRSGRICGSNQICEAWNDDRSDRRERSRRNMPEQRMYSGKSNDSCIDIIS